MGPTIRSLVIPVSDLDAAKAIYTALLGSPHTDESYYVGYNIDGFEVGLAPGEAAGGPVAYADVEDLDATRATLLAAGATERSAPRQVAPEARVCVLFPAGLLWVLVSRRNAAVHDLLTRSAVIYDWSYHAPDA